MDCTQAGLEDFAYMDGVVDVDDLKEQIVMTGDEVGSQPPSHDSMSIKLEMFFSGGIDEIHLG